MLRRVQGNRLRSGIAGGGSAPATIGDQTIAYGALTLESAGGAKAVDSLGNEVSFSAVTAQAGFTRTWSVDGNGRLIANGTPSVDDGKTLTATVAGFGNSIQVTIQTSGTTANGVNLANAYSAATGELAAIVALGFATIDGKTVLGRRGLDIQSATPGNTQTYAATQTYTTGLTITSENYTYPSFLRRQVWRNNGTINYEQIVIRDTIVSGDNASSTMCVRFQNAPVINLDTIEAYSDTVAGQQFNIDGTGAVVTGSDVDLSASAPDLSGIKIGLSVLSMNSHTPSYVITAFDNTTKIVTVTGSPTQGAGVWYICNFASLNLFGVTGSAVTVTNSYLHDGRTLIGGTPTAFTATGNIFDSSYGDMVSFSLLGTETAWTVARNSYGKAYGLSSDAGNPHVDANQLNLQGMTNDNSVAYTYEGNSFFPAGGRTHNIQPIFITNAPSPRLVLANIQFNYGLTGSANGIDLERGHPDSVIQFNEILYDQNVSPGDTTFAPAIRLETVDTGVEVQYNIIPYIVDVGGAVLNRNYEFGSTGGDNTNATYSALLTGTDFDSDSMANAAAMAAALLPNGNTTMWPVGGVKIGALAPGYYNFTTGAIDTPLTQTGFDPVFTDQTDVPVSTLTTSNEVTISGVSASIGVLVRVSGDGSPTFRVRDGSNNVLKAYSNAEWVCFNGDKITLQATSDADPAETGNVLVTCGTQSDTWSITTEDAMALVSINGLMRWPGIMPANNAAMGITSENTLDAAGEYVSYVFQAKENMVVSHVAWRNSTATGSPTADVRIETVGTDGIPTGTLWGTNTNGASGTLVSNTSNLTALTASATITKGQFYAVKIVYASGTSFIVVRLTGPKTSSSSSPYYVTNTSGSAVKGVTNSSVVIAIGSSTTTFYPIENAFMVSSVANNSFDNTSGAKRGLRFQVPFDCRCAGISWANSTVLGNFNIILEDDAGTELNNSSTAFDGDQAANAVAGPPAWVFDNPVELTANTWYRAVLQPTQSGTNINLSVATLPSANYRSAWPGGLNVNYATYTTGGGWVDTATDQIPIMDILIDQLLARP